VTEKGRLLATGNVAEVFEWGSRVLKLYKSPAAKPVAFREAAIHAAVEALGLPVPSVWGVEQVDTRWGIVFDRISGTSFADRMRRAPDAVPDYLDRMARLYVAIHCHAAVSLANLKLRLASLAAMPDGDQLCHGDFHPLNILGDADRHWVIDWPDACRGDPAADLCRSYVLLALHARKLAAPYLDAYRSVGDVSRQAALAWLPYIAGTKMAEEVPGELDGLRHLLDLR
jgi:tRNA A-37 threonylcarbamoyl transferase component Bud32